MPKVTAGPQLHDPDPAHPVLGSGTGPGRYHLIGDPDGLTQFGAQFEVLPPGSRSGFRRWHETEDEMIYVLTGEVMLIEDIETPLVADAAACRPAGHPVGHCLENRSRRDARCLTIGARNRVDRIHHPDQGLITDKDGAARRYTWTEPERSA